MLELGMQHNVVCRFELWKTAHAEQCARNEVKDPFAIIIACDFYA